MQTIIEKSVIPDEIINRKQWALSHNKAPYQTNGERASSTDMSTWTSYEDAINNSNHVGYFISEHDPYTVIDLDDCIINDVITKEAKSIVETLNSYTEISQSGTGLHVFVKGSKPGNRSKNSTKGLEMYDKERFMVMTGNHLEGMPTVVNGAQEAINYLYDVYFPNNEVEHKEHVQQSPPMSDDEILKIAYHAKNSDKFEALMNGDISAYGSHSEADQALVNLIAPYTQDFEQIDRIFTNSGMYRDKWDREDYKASTIEKAINDRGFTYKGNQKLDFQLHINESQSIKKGSWWYKETESSKATFLHHVMAQYILQENEIVRFPNEDGDIYIYNKNTGIYEIDKTCRRIKSIIRSNEILKNNAIREVRDYIVDMSKVARSESIQHVAVKNGLLDLKNMKLIDFTPSVFLTKRIPTRYNANAYDEFVNKTLQKVSSGHKPTIKNICEMFGAVLYPKLLVPKMFYLYGRSAHNGKSTIAFMIQKTFNTGNDISAVSPQKLATNTFAGSSIYGKIANIVDDLPGEVIEDSGLLKTIITGGYIDIEAKGKDSQTVKMDTVCITASNHYPSFKEHGTQINKRLYIIPFDHDFMNDSECMSELESMNLLEKDSAKEYVLKLAVDALKEMTTREGDVLTFNEKVEEATQSFSEYNDPLADFFHEYDRTYFEEVRGTDALKEYHEWCKDNHIQYPLGNKRFKDAVCSKYDMEWKDKKLKINGNWKTFKGFKSM